MSRDSLQLWFLLVFAMSMGLALLVRGLRGAGNPGPFRSQEDRDHVVRGRRRARHQHHAFAHVLLRDRVLADPAATFDAIALPGCGDFLVDLWSAARSDDEPFLSPEGLRVDVEGDIALVTVPPPARISEVYMIAVARNPGAYFVLERGEQGPFLAEWRRDTRLRLQEISPPTRRLFLAAVRGAIEERQRSGL
jgi:hypothetical protein